MPLVSAGGHTAPGSALFSGSGCQFGNGGNTVSGNLTSQSVYIPASGGTLSFNYRIVNECGSSGSTCYYDRLTFNYHQMEAVLGQQSLILIPIMVTVKW